MWLLSEKLMNPAGYELVSLWRPVISHCRIHQFRLQIDTGNLKLVAEPTLFVAEGLRRIAMETNRELRVSELEKFVHAKRIPT